MRSALLICFASLVMSVLFSAAANAQPSPESCTERDIYGNCLGWNDSVEDSGPSGVGGGSHAAGETRESGPRVCVFEGRIVACNSEGGTWFDLVSAWCRLRVPPPPPEHRVWSGRTDGSVFVCMRPGYGGIPDPNITFDVWLAPAQEAVDPVALAWRAVASMNLSAPQLGMFPQPLGQDSSAMGYVGWPLWLWVEDPGPGSWGPNTASASDQGFTVTATAWVDHVEWDMGNGDVVVCGVGSRHPVHAVRGESSPDCGYVYEVEGMYPVTARAYWVVEWSAPSGSGELSLELARADEVLIGEVQVVNVPVGQR